MSELDRRMRDGTGSAMADRVQRNTVSLKDDDDAARTLVRGKNASESKEASVSRALNAQSLQRSKFLWSSRRKKESLRR